MVHILLMITAELENIATLQPQDGCDDPNFSYFFNVFPLHTPPRIKCGNCGEMSQRETCVTLSDTIPLQQGKGTAHLIQKCKFCGREGTVTMIPGRGKPLTQDVSEKGMYAPLMMFDCRGYEPEGFLFGDGWKAESMVGTKFENIDLSGEEFNEYDEKGKCPVMISNINHKFEVVK